MVAVWLNRFNCEAKKNTLPQNSPTIKKRKGIMGKFKLKSVIGVGAVLAFSSSLFGQVVVDDLEHGSNQNSYGYYWYTFDDANDNKSGTISEVPEFQGGQGPGLNSDYAAKLEFTLGATWPESGYTGQPFAGLGTDLASETGSVDLTGLTAISFDIRSTVALEVEFALKHKKTYDLGYNEYHVLIETGSEWENVTVNVADLKQHVGWGKNEDLDVSIAQALSWMVKGDDNPAGTSGELWVDNVVFYGVDAPVLFDECPDCIVDANFEGKGAKFSDFEGGITENAVGAYWYSYDDTPEGSTMITAGADVLGLDIGLNGRDGAYGAQIGFILGNPYAIDGNTVQPFAGLGTNLTDALEEKSYNASADNVTGIYFEYKTTGLNELVFEVVDRISFNEGRGDAVQHYIKLPATDGAWVGAVVEWDVLVLPDWDHVVATPLNTADLMKLQFKGLGAAQSEGTLAIDNVYFMGATSITPFGDDNSVIMPKRNVSASGLSATYNRGAVSVNWNPSSEIQSGTISLINARGAQVASAPVSKSATVNSTLNAGSIAAGLYFIRVQAVDVNGKGINMQVPVNVVK